MNANDDRLVIFSIDRRFAAGFITHVAIVSLLYDYWGMKGTIQHLVDGWMTPWLTVPFAVVTLAVAYLLMREPKPEAEAETEAPPSDADRG